MNTMKWIEGCGAVLLVSSLIWTTGCGGGGDSDSDNTTTVVTNSAGGTTAVVTNTAPVPGGGTTTQGSGSTTPPAASQLVAAQIVKPVNNQIFFIGVSEDISFEWTPVPGATAYFFELDGVQHGGTVTCAKVNLGLGVHTCRVWGLVDGQPGPASESITFSLESIFAP